MKARVILHSDLNNFYASVECLHNPGLRNKPVAVCGDAELRHGIVLSKNYIAKGYGIKTAETIQDAKRKCPDLVLVKADYKKYLGFSKSTKEIYDNYTDRVESFGIDECWLDVTDGDGKAIADEIRERIKKELGLTVSIGVSWNKIYAKLGSDMKKPDATTVIDKDNYKDKVFVLPADNLLYVGKATQKKLQTMNISTIGDIANADIKFLTDHLGKWGEYLYIYANGLDSSDVKKVGTESIIKSIGNSTTTFRDLVTVNDVRILVTMLSESVASRLRGHGLKGRVISVWIRNKHMVGWGMQQKISRHTDISAEIICCAMALFNNYNFANPIRSIGIRVSDLCSDQSPVQLDLFGGEEKRAKQLILDKAIDSLRTRFGHHSIKRAVEYTDKTLSGFDYKEDNVIHPVGYL